MHPTRPGYPLYGVCPSSCTPNHPMDTVKLPTNNDLCPTNLQYYSMWGNNYWKELPDIRVPAFTSAIT